MTNKNKTPKKTMGKSENTQKKGHQRKQQEQNGKTEKQTKK